MNRYRIQFNDLPARAQRTDPAELHKIFGGCAPLHSKCDIRSISYCCDRCVKLNFSDTDGRCR
jgi:hypothetical protein